MDFTSFSKKILTVSVLGLLLTACGGGGSKKSEPPVDNTAPNKPSAINISSSNNGSITVTGFAEADSTVTATFPDGSEKTVKADSSGNINFSLNSVANQPEGVIKITSTDKADNTSKAATVSSDTVIRTLYKATGSMPKLSFIPSLGINTEGPQGGADTAGMPVPFVDIFRTARPFAEQQKRKKDAQGEYLLNNRGGFIYIKTDNIFDANGWITELDPETKLNSNEPEIRSSTTKMLQGALKGSIPEGKYTFIYEGSGTLEFSPSGALSRTGIKKVSNENKYILDIALHEFIDPENEQETSSKNQLAFGIKDITPSNYIKNIRIIMPGGTCTGNPFLRVDSNDECPNGSNYESFEERLQADRNAIIFNPDYLRFLRNFKVIRMMNLMEASLKKFCYSAGDCPADAGTWNNRAKLNDAFWGGNDGRTAHEDHKGVPLEVIIALANTIQRDIWINIPHFAKDNYIKKTAQMFQSNLNNNLSVYLEYSNEVWNSGFSAGKYMSTQGADIGLNTIPQGSEVFPSDKYTRHCNRGLTQKERDTRRCKNYFSRLRYFSQRSVEVFNLWQEKFIDKNRLTRVLGSFIGDPLLTDLMLKHIPNGEATPVSKHIDAVAIAPYFYGCPYRNEEHNFCNGKQKVLSEVTSVDDVFEIIDQPAFDPDDPDKYFDIKGLEGTIFTVKRQLSVLNNNEIKLITYEGGQHLVPSVFGDKVSSARQTVLRKLFNEANRDPRMKERYIRFLNAWKDLSDDGTALFTLYTMPQSYYRFGNFGIKEHLNKPRSESPKFDGAMTFQESVKECWWDGCNP